MSLYLVGTPIGNLDDLSSRALETLKHCPVILVEKKTDSWKLIKKFNLQPEEIISFDERRQKKITPQIISRLQTGLDIALITSAGLPGISDPGAYLVSACYQAGLIVKIIPGPSALSTAISATGFTGSFWFVGFLPRTKGKIIKLLKQAETLKTNLVCFESTHRLEKTLSLLDESFADKQIFVGKEMTKVFEQYLVGRPNDFLIKIKTDKHFVKGEFTLVINFSEK